jgi:uncharacterized FlaG/YvyC family protein
MNDTSIKPIGKVRMPEAGTHTKASAADRTDAAVREKTALDSDRSIKKAVEQAELQNKMSNISIHFNVDEETNRLIVVVSDRQSGRVIRTIPASELDKMQAGELLKLTA